MPHSATPTAHCRKKCPLRDFTAVMARAVANPAAIEKLTLHDGEPAYRAGDPASAVYFVRAGLVKLVAGADAADERAGRIVRIAGAAGVIGLEALFLPSFRYSAIAMGKVAACRIATANLRCMLDAAPESKMRLLGYCHGELARVEAWLADFADHSATARVRIARLLLHMREGRTSRLHCLRHHDMAAVLGVAMETICRNLTRMTHDGLISEYKSASSSGYFDADIARLEQVAHGG